MMNYWEYRWCTKEVTYSRSTEFWIDKMSKEWNNRWLKSSAEPIWFEDNKWGYPYMIYIWGIIENIDDVTMKLLMIGLLNTELTRMSKM